MDETPHDLTIGERVVPIPGASVMIDRQGTGSETIFIHGFGSDLHLWDPIWDQRPASRSYLRYDLRGFGRSKPDTSERFSHSADLAALLDALSIEQVDLVGASKGGGIALSFALDHPDRVRTLSLISPAITAWEWSDDWRQRWRPIVNAAKSGRMDEARDLWWMHPLFATTRQTAAASLLHREITDFAGDQWLADHEAPSMPDVDRLHELRPPTLLMSGGQDQDDFKLIADLIEACGQNVRREHRPDLGHLLHLEDPDWCSRRLIDNWNAVSGV